MNLIESSAPPDHRRNGMEIRDAAYRPADCATAAPDRRFSTPAGHGTRLASSSGELMIRSRILKHSLIDYPGKVSCVLFLPGCNFHCPYCHNPQLVAAGEPAADPAAVSSLWPFLEDRRGFLDAVVVSGGEPTLHAGLPAICRRIRQMGFAVKLDTNGSRPDVLRKLLAEDVVDYIAMDVKSDPRRYVPLLCNRDARRQIEASIELILNSGRPHEFRTTCVRPLVDAAAVRSIVRLIGGCHLYVLQALRVDRVLHPGFFQDRDRACDDRERRRLRDLAAPSVQACVLR